ncbi:hypothetical protein [Streptomyces sp. NPDC012510]|uniref:hypothetical protein n=1 Tax=Streptomyces sp. NPDC012510 TaxID=3364838 RepID=UPI0036E3F17A
MLGVNAVLAESFERIHRSNLIGMGVLPLQFGPGDNARALGLTGEETYTAHGLAELPREVTVEATGAGDHHAVHRTRAPGQPALRHTRTGGGGLDIGPCESEACCAREVPIAKNKGSSKRQVNCSISPAPFALDRAGAQCEGGGLVRGVTMTALAASRSVAGACLAAAALAVARAGCGGDDDFCLPDWIRQAGGKKHRGAGLLSAEGIGGSTAPDVVTIRTEYPYQTLKAAPQGRPARGVLPLDRLRLFSQSIDENPLAA